MIGDDGSTDGGTDDVTTEDGHVRVAFGPPTNSYAARNRAVARLDRTDPRVLRRGLPARAGMARARHRGARTNGRRGRTNPIRRPEPADPWTLVDMDGSKDHEHQVRVGVAETANLFLSRELFDRVGGFEGEIPEYGDFEFVERCIASGAQLQYAADAVVSHPARTSGRSLMRALWKYNRGYAVHAARDGEVPDGVKLRSWVPVVQTLALAGAGGGPSGPIRAGCAQTASSPRPARPSQRCRSCTSCCPISATSPSCLAGAKGGGYDGSAAGAARARADVD